MPTTSDGFELVSRRRRRKLKPVRNLETSELDESELDCEALLCKVFDATTVLGRGSFRASVFDGLTESLNALNSADISQVICYGLGQFSQNRSSRYQLALLLSLKARYGCRVYLYDPRFLIGEIRAFETLGLDVIDRNEEGKRVIEDGITLVYMPHCPNQLTNNFLYANWSKGLGNCIILANSFTDIIGSSVTKNIVDIASYMLRIHPYATEIRLENDFEYTEVFSGLNIHFFPRRRLDEAPVDFWTDRKEPSYRQENEFITVEEAS